MYDVIVIGGGPAGSCVANKLAGIGYGVVVLEQKARLGERVCCTGIISQECISSFGINDNIILRRVNSARLFSPSGKLLRLWREKTQACIVDRAEFDRTIAGQAQDNGAEYLLNSSAKDLEVENGSVTVEATCQGRRSSFKARAVVITTGFSSGLTVKLDLGKIDDFALGAQAEVGTSGIDEVEVYFGQRVAPGFFAWLVPISPQRALVGLMSRQSPELYLRKLMATLMSEGKIISTEARLNYGGIPLKPLARTYGERLIVVGDAAGQVKPTSGGGIYYSLLCAEIAANTLSQALERNDLSAKYLSNYERRWKRNLARELEVGYYGRKLYEHLSDRHIDKVFDIMKSDGIDAALCKAEDLSFDWHSQAVLRLIRHKAVSKALEVIKFPFSRKVG